MLDEAGPGAVDHRQATAVHVVGEPTDLVAADLAVLLPAQGGDGGEVGPVPQDVGQAGQVLLPVGAEDEAGPPVQQTVREHGGKGPAAHHRRGAGRPGGLQHLIGRVQVHGAHHRQAHQHRLGLPHHLAEELQLLLRGGAGADGVEVLVKDGAHGVARPLQGGLEIAHPQGLLIVKSHQHHGGLGGGHLLRHGRKPPETSRKRTIIISNGGKMSRQGPWGIFQTSPKTASRGSPPTPPAPPSAGGPGRGDCR